MKPPKNVFLAEFFNPLKKAAKVPRSSLEKNCYLPGHNAVSETGALLRERLGRFPFDMEYKVFIKRFKAFLS
jgi:hypothetical protein